MKKVLEQSATNAKETSMDDLNIKRIVVAVDLSPHSERTAAYAADFAKSFGASITLVHVFNTEPVRTHNANETPAEEERHKTERKLGELVRKIRQTYENCDMRFRNGDPAEQITGLAQDLGADLIITASHHPPFLTRLFGWDQAPRILHQASCPVLVYHEAPEKLACGRG
ncbi:MAG: universal stress protein [Chthoniobacterales bacterium]